MRGKLSDQDLTDYALNELQPEERLYAEAILAVSEECRQDVYGMIELSQMLEEGFEAEASKQVIVELKPRQREELLNVKVPMNWKPMLATLGAAACTALAISHPEIWKGDARTIQLAQNVTAQVSNYVTGAVNTTVATVSSADADAEIAPALGTFQKLAEDPALRKWFSTDWLAPEFDTPQGPWAQPAATWDPMPHAALDMP